MYSFDWSGDLGARLGRMRTWQTWRRVAPNVWFIGITSLLTDISSEMVASILPLYLVVGLGLSPFLFGVVDGLYPGVTALVRWAGGLIGDRSRQHKALAALGYGVSAASRVAWLLVGGHLAGIMATVTADRMGKGVRTAPRDALISLSTPPEALGAAFGVHRAMDAAGAMLGPLAAAAILLAAPRRFDAVFVISFALALVGLGVLLVFVRTPVGNLPGASLAPPGAPLAGPARLLPSSAGLWLTLGAGAALAMLTISDAFVYLVLQRRGFVAPDAIPLLFVGTNATYLLLAVPVGALSDRLPRWKIFLSGHVSLGIVYAALLSPGLGPATLPVTLIFLGAYYASTDGVLSAMASAVLPRHERGSGLGLLATATNLGRLAASLLFGWMWSAYGTDTALGLFTAGLLLVLLPGGLLLARAQREIIAP